MVLIIHRLMIRAKLGGIPPNFCTFNARKISKIFEICTFNASNFLRKIAQIFPKISEIFHISFKIEKMYHFCTQIGSNSIYRSNLAKFSPKSTKTAIFSLKTSIFSKFSAPSAPKICTFDTQKTRYLYLVSPPPEAKVSPLIYLWL